MLTVLAAAAADWQFADWRFGRRAFFGDGPDCPAAKMSEGSKRMRKASWSCACARDPSHLTSSRTFSGKLCTVSSGFAGQFSR